MLDLQGKAEPFRMEAKEFRTKSVQNQHVYVKDIEIYEDFLFFTNLHYGLHMIKFYTEDEGYSYKMKIHAQFPLDGTPSCLSLCFNRVTEELYLMVTTVSPVSLFYFNITDVEVPQFARFYSSKKSELYTFANFVTSNEKYFVLEMLNQNTMRTTLRVIKRDYPSVDATIA